MVPGAGLTLAEQMGTSSKVARFQNTDGTHMAGANEGVQQSAGLNEFTRLENYAKAFAPDGK